MKKLMTLALVASLGVSQFAIAKDELSIKFGTAAGYPPFEYHDQNNDIVGFDIDIANALCKELDAKCTFTHQVFDSLIASLKFNRFDAIISGMDVTPERTKQVLFSQTYYANSALFIGKRGSADDVSQLKGKKVGVQNGTTHQKYILDKYPQMTLVAYDSYQTAVMDLSSGRLDAVFGDTAVVNEWLKNDATLGPVGKTITDPVYFGTGMAIAVKQGNSQLADKINQGLNTIKANGEYQKVYDKWFPAS